LTTSDRSETDSATGASAICQRHADAPARWRCAFCDAFLCDACVSVRDIRERTVTVCKECGGRCERIGEEVAERVPEAVGEPVPTSLNLFTFPFQGDGLYILAAGTVVLGLVRTIALFSFAAWFLELVVTFYLATYWLKVIRFVAYDAEELPDWPSVEEDEIVANGLRFTVLVLACTLPSRIYMLQAGGWTGELDTSNPIGWLLTIAGVVYFPMGMLALAVLGDLTAAGPHIVLPAIARVGLAYLPVVGLVLGLIVVETILVALAGAVPLLGPFLSAAITLYLLVVAMTLLGDLYRRHRDAIGWDR